MRNAYNLSVKPMISNFKSKYGKSDRGFLKDILQSTNYKSRNNLKIQTFGYWGRKINPHLWASIYVENVEKTASNSFQFYILVDETGLKFGFDYGDRITNDDSIVKEIKEDGDIRDSILSAINKNNLKVVNSIAGDPKFHTNIS